MANNLTTSSANFTKTGSDFINNFYKPNYSISADQNTAILSYFESITNNTESAKILASSVVYTSMAQGLDPMAVLDQMRQMNVEDRNKFTTMFLNFNRIGTSQLGIRSTSKFNQYIQRMIEPSPSAYADGSSPRQAANNARQIRELTGTTRNGYYWIRGNNGTPMQVYCDMNGNEAGSNLSGWMRFDQELVSRYRTTAIDDNYIDYSASAGGSYTILNQRNGFIRGVRWDLGPSVKITGIRITRIKFNCVGGQDGYFAADAPVPQWGGNLPTNTQVANFVNEPYLLGNNFSCYGWAMGNGKETSQDLVRVYKQAYSGSGGVEWPEQFSGLVTLTDRSFLQIDSTEILNGRYIYYYESDGIGEYNNLLEYTVWVR